MGKNKKSKILSIYYGALLTATFFSAGWISGAIYKKKSSEVTTDSCVITQIPYKISVDSLRNRIIRQGDIKSYNLLKDYFIRKDTPWDIFYYSLVMSDIFNYYQACYDVNQSLLDIYRKYNLTIDKETKEIATYYLHRGDSIKQSKHILYRQ